MTDILISCRQADAGASAIALRDDLAQVFGDDRVFLGKDALKAENWHEQVQGELEKCKVLLLVIGPRWLTITEEQNRPPIQLRDDLHRQEIAFLLDQSNVTVIPVFVEQSVVPRADQLPPDLQRLTSRQARSIASDQARRIADLAVLVADIQSVVHVEAPVQPTTEKPPVQETSPPSRIGWLKLEVPIVIIAFALTLFAGMYAYLANWQMDVQQLLFLFVVFYALMLALRWLWARVFRERWRKT
jgi:hypothetical protein